MSFFATHLSRSVQTELEAAALAESRGHFDTACRHLERAHVIGQRSTLAHVVVHRRMFGFAWRQGRRREMLGQLGRIAGAALFTAVGLVPRGNTGGADVSAFRRMPIPPDLQAAIDADRAWRARAVGRPAATAAGPAPLERRADALHLRRLAAREPGVVPAVAMLAALTLAGCAAPPADLDRSLDRTTSAGVYRVTMVPPTPAAPINQMHSWKLRLAGPDGAPIHAARVSVDGGMPQHGHGLPTRPRVTRELEDGTYLLEGMKFSMTGWWELKLDIQGPLGADRITFNTVLEPSGALR